VTTNDINITFLEISYKNKSIFKYGSGYAGFGEVLWSPNSRYLAVVEHGIKTMMILKVFEVSDNQVSEVLLPDYRLNILGRFQQFEGGRYWFDEDLIWKDLTLTFSTRGSLKEGLSDPENDPGNWYKFLVSLEFGGGNSAAQPSITQMKPIKMENKSQ
jgi:hypothetical protein